MDIDDDDSADAQKHRSGYTFKNIFNILNFRRHCRSIHNILFNLTQTRTAWNQYSLWYKY